MEEIDALEELADGECQNKEEHEYNTCPRCLAGHTLNEIGENAQAVLQWAYKLGAKRPALWKDWWTP